MLRPRYRNDWEPSWLGSKQPRRHCEDGNRTVVGQFDCCHIDVEDRLRLQWYDVTTDATRLSDGRIVSIKKVKKSDHPIEEQIIRFLSDTPQSIDPRNHSVPVYDVLQSPIDQDIILLVMPYLVPVEQYRFATVGEVMEYFRQIFEVIIRHVRSTCRRMGTKSRLLGSAVHAQSPYRILARCLNCNRDWLGMFTKTPRQQRPAVGERHDGTNTAVVRCTTSHASSPHLRLPREGQTVHADKASH